MTRTKLKINYFGDKIWRNKKGQEHRENGPAIIYADGEMRWYVNGTLNRFDGPSIIYNDGNNCWYLDDYCIRTFSYD